MNELIEKELAAIFRAIAVKKDFVVSIRTYGFKKEQKVNSRVLNEK